MSAAPSTEHIFVSSPSTNTCMWYPYEAHDTPLQRDSFTLV